MDITLLIEEYLRDKTELRDYENDSFAVENNQIIRWGFANIACPSMEELLTYSEISDDRHKQDRINTESLAYLASTDWYVIRSVETGVPVPEEVTLKRAEARAKVQ